jgi:hypothetical protein
VKWRVYHKTPCLQKTLSLYSCILRLAYVNCNPWQEVRMRKSMFVLPTEEYIVPYHLFHTCISVLSASYYLVILLLHNKLRLYTAVIKCLLTKQLRGFSPQANKFKRKSTSQIENNVALMYLMPDCWKDVSLHPEKSCDLPTRSRVSAGLFCPEENAEFFSPNSTLHCMLHVQPSQW